MYTERETCEHSTLSGRQAQDLCADLYAGLSFIVNKGGEWSVDLQTITTLIGSLGFPIAACIACFSMLNKEREEHKQEMQKVTEAIVNNTMALEALKGKLDGN